MLAKFVKEMKTTLDENEYRQTENGAVGYRTTGRELVDMNFLAASMRNMTARQIEERFVRVFYEHKLLAVKWLFYAFDVREGLGERRLFCVCFSWLARRHREVARAVLPLIPEYGRWDSLFFLLDTDLAGDVTELLWRQLADDLNAMAKGEPVSLLAKWMPSVNASSEETRRRAHLLAGAFGMTARQYRKMLSGLRAYLGVTEVQMCQGAWETIDYRHVPSRANLIYRRAFYRHDEARRQAYLNSLKEGKTTIHAGVLFPHDIVHRYHSYRGWAIDLKETEDASLEALWKALPDFVGENGNTICVADGSGSMSACVGATDLRCLDVANALAIYFAERCQGAMKDRYITFSSHPQFVALGQAASLREKLEIAECHNEVANTNIEAVFDLILATAVKGRLRQEELPRQILILSDMEFDACAECGGSRITGESAAARTLFSEFRKRYAAHGYRLPRLIFWNICSRTGTIPVRMNAAGAALVSGFSPTILRTVLKGAADPLECLLAQLKAGRYAAVEEAVKTALGNAL